MAVSDPPLAVYTVNNWASRVVAAGGNYPSSSIPFLTTFVKGLLDNNLYSKMININCFAPDNLTAAITPLIATAGSGSSGLGNTWTNIGFVAGDLNVNGLLGDGSSYLKTGTRATDAPTNNVGLTLYQSNDVTTGNPFGSDSGGAPDFQLHTNIGGLAYFDCYNQTTGTIKGTALANGSGYTSGNRTDATNQYLYKANSGVAHVQIAGPGGAPGTIPTPDVWCFALNNNNSAFGITGKQLSFAGIHQGLTEAESAIFFTLIQALRISLGGGYV